jgi:hypothetical protein
MIIGVFTGFSPPVLTKSHQIVIPIEIKDDTIVTRPTT